MNQLKQVIHLYFYCKILNNIKFTLAAVVPLLFCLLHETTKPIYKSLNN
jgi:hypothetical protein